MTSFEKHVIKAKNWFKKMLSEEVDLDGFNEQEREDFQELRNGTYEKWRNEQKFDEDKTWAELEKKMKNKSKFRFRYWYSVAAVFAMCLFGYQFYFLFQNYQTQNREALVVPGRSQAYLEIDNTRRIELGRLDTLILSEKSELRLNAEKIVYASSEEKTGKRNAKKNEYHKINVPRNAEFYVELSDGTKVWVNSESSIEFYSRFESATRTVKLTGEAYFEVAENKRKPFIVETQNAKIKVLGTAFNVKAYPDENRTYTTLTEGKVDVSSENMEEVLQPREQLVLENATGKHLKNKVNPSIYSAWMRGKFVFKDESLEDILHAISRWYDIQVFYENSKLKEEKFSVSLNRYENISSLLKHFETTEFVRFEMKGKALIVK